MDEPQDSFLKLPTAIETARARMQLSGYEARVLAFIIRKTFGWNKPVDTIPLSQFVEGTGLNKRHVINTITRLVDRRVIFKSGTEIRTRKPGTYAVNKQTEQWQLVPKSVPAPHLVPKSVPNLVRKSAPSIYTQESIDKNKILSTLEPLPKSVPDTTPDQPKTFTPERKAMSPETADVLAYLNQRTGKKFRNPGDIPARLAETTLQDGKRIPTYSVADAKRVIDKKCREWTGTAFAKHLDPVSLFRPANFDRYLNQPESSPTAVTLQDFYKHPIGLQSQWVNQPKQVPEGTYERTPEQDAAFDAIEAEIAAAAPKRRAQ
jgi:phage replication O-like protein O